MSMPLDFVQLEFWTYGFMGAIFTSTWWTGPGIAFYLWFVLVQLAIHREDPPDLQFDFHSWPAISLLSGIWTGFWLTWSLRVDILVDTAMTNYRNNRRYLAPEFTLITIGALVATLGYYYWNGDFSDGFGAVPDNVALGVGITLFVLGWILAIVIILWAFISRVDSFNKVMNTKYTLLLAVGITIAPALYDYPHNSGFQPWHGLLALAGIIVYWLLAYLFVGWVIGNKENASARVQTAKGGFFGGVDKFADTSNIDRFTTKAQARTFILYGFISQFLVYLIGWLVDINTGEEPEPVVMAIGITSAIISIAFIVLGSMKHTVGGKYPYEKVESAEKFVNTQLPTHGITLGQVLRK